MATGTSTPVGQDADGNRFRHQLDVLIERELHLQVARFDTWVLMLGQPALIGLFLGLAFTKEATPACYLSMGIAAIWMGCLNACTAVARERDIFLRERMFGLQPSAYLLAKLAVLGLWNLPQVLVLLSVQLLFMTLPGGVWEWTWYGVVMFMAALSANGLGLAVSAMVRSVRMAVMAVPILLIPQIIFSKPILADHLVGIADRIEDFTLTKWVFEALSAINRQGESGIGWQELCLSALVLILCMVVFIGIGTLSLKTGD